MKVRGHERGQRVMSTTCSLSAGDAYTYTLQPVFGSLGRQFRCHVRRRRPTTLYQLWFYITVPGTDFETPRVRRQVGAHGALVPLTSILGVRLAQANSITLHLYYTVNRKKRGKLNNDISHL